MDDKLKSLLERARTVRVPEEELEEQRIALAAANGNLSEERITLDTMTAARTIMKAAGKKD